MQQSGVIIRFKCNNNDDYSAWYLQQRGIEALVILQQQCKISTTMSKYISFPNIRVANIDAA